MKKSIIYLLGIAIVIPAFMSCSDFLDQNPDLRTTLDSEEKIANILVSAYISGAGSYQLVAELSSDNVCDYGITKNYNQFYQDVYELPATTTPRGTSGVRTTTTSPTPTRRFRPSRSWEDLPPRGSRPAKAKR